MTRFRVCAITIALVLAVGCADDAANPSPTSFVTAGPTTSAAPGDTTESSAPPESTTPDATAPLTEDAIVLTPVAEGFSAAVDVGWRNGTMYIVEQGGRIVPVVDGARGAPVLDFADQVSDGGEQGLLGLAFDPELPLAYVNYTDNEGHTVIAEFAVADDGTFDRDNGRLVLTVDQPYGNHNGGGIAFGPDGMLYIGMGDGGAGGDPERRALNLAELLGKMLRIDPHANGSQPYTVPTDNPFVGVAGARPEIWSIGLRNPWRFNFDSATGDLWIGDVGQGDWEEVDVVHASEGAGRGTNFGWSAFEGTHPYNGDQSAEGATPPIYEYSHDEGCSISGGTVYRGNAIPSLRGWYLFSDYCSGSIWALREVPGTSPIVLTVASATSVSEIVDGPDGELYVLDYATGIVSRIDAS